jgi:hypothetical protein
MLSRGQSIQSVKAENELPTADPGEFGQRGQGTLSGRLRVLFVSVSTDDGHQCTLRFATILGMQELEHRSARLRNL